MSWVVVCICRWRSNLQRHPLNQTSVKTDCELKFIRRRRIADENAAFGRLIISNAACAEHDPATGFAAHCLRLVRLLARQDGRGVQVARVDRLHPLRQLGRGEATPRLHLRVLSAPGRRRYRPRTSQPGLCAAAPVHRRSSRVHRG